MTDFFIGMSLGFPIGVLLTMCLFYFTDEP